MKRKNGFTLVELLAVIVILAIIALIAVPIVMNVIEDSKVGAAKSSALGYLDAIEKQMARNMMDSDKTNDFNDGAYEISELETKGVKVKGDKPTEGWVQIEQGKIKDYSFKIGKYFINPDSNNKVEAKKSGEVKEKPAGGSSSNTPVVKTYTVGEAVSYNPVSGEKCSNPKSTPGTKTGCMKWYVIKDNGSSVDVILDHNTTATVAWNSNKSNESMGEVATALSTDTTGWASGLNPRLITANEVVEIVGKTTVSSFRFGTEYRYLTTYLGNADAGYGYWTSTPKISNNNGAPTPSMPDGEEVEEIDRAWIIGNGDGSTNYRGSLNNDQVTVNVLYGVRPVITLSKSVISS